MKVIAVFNTDADISIIRKGIEELRNVDGVRSMEPLEKVEGSFPLYCYLYEIDDSKSQEAIKGLQKVAGKYWEHISNHDWGAYKKLD